MTIILRLEIHKKEITFGEIATVISKSGGDMIAIDVIKEGPEMTVRDISVNVNSDEKQKMIIDSIHNLPGVSVKHVSDRTFLLHLGGKIEVKSKTTIDNREELSQVYTPEVARICMAIEENPKLAYNLTIKKNTVAVVSNATAVLGLGKISPEAAMPVMEGKAMLFKQFAGVDAYPLCLHSNDTEEMIRIIKALSPSFGGINLEDIASPQCFEIEQRLKKELDIPVFHDDQHGTAIVALAGLLNALKVTKKRIENCKIVVCGIGAAGIAITKMLLAGGAKNVIGVDRHGALNRDETYDNEMWNWYASNTNPSNEKGPLSSVIKGADVFIGVSAPNVLKVEDVKNMAHEPIVFALANPNPEISPEVAKPYVKVMATGRSDYPNQVNNVLCFPGMFRGVLDCRASDINEEMKLAAAEAIASTISEEELNEDYIIPGVFNDQVVPKIREAVIKAGYETGVAKKKD
ncbi:malate dehydrogenase (oxaloacetate-decarboxylating) [Evansella vedderi]|uniref:Malate dehydrogenase (Oxaloacetate-decarboxylating) n=1 Tax=Evansella vedderi TaxID=38282 RepID=A0ABT9ZS51_9BACI|nr:NAD-dependent malic enzyme [Evansella vedderi]MDQ0253571.1 malate dehydrogenase (oxaloacetate-decarboxylating) [Evansella vedderi]